MQVYDSGTHTSVSITLFSPSPLRPHLQLPSTAVPPPLGLCSPLPPPLWLRRQPLPPSAGAGATTALAPSPSSAAIATRAPSPSIAAIRHRYSGSIAAIRRRRSTARDDEDYSDGERGEANGGESVRNEGPSSPATREAIISARRRLHRRQRWWLMTTTSTTATLTMTRGVKAEAARPRIHAAGQIRARSCGWPNPAGVDTAQR